ncbi:MAG TPA: carboxypeptidase-like regulatory domain-containing protein [Bacteroidia bacterium]
MKTIKKITLFFILIMGSLVGTAQNSSGEIRGLIVDEELNPAMGAQVKVLQAGVMIKQAVVDEQGKYAVKPLQPGNYEVLIMYIGYKTFRYSKVEVSMEEASYLDAQMELNALDGPTITADKPWEKPIVEKSYITMHSINFEDLGHMAVTKGDVSGMIANISSDVFVSEEGQIYSRGSRVGASKTYVDGELLPFDTEISGMAIQNLSVITGGIPAQYGDLTGAAIVISTRDYFSGIAEKNIRQRNYQEKLAKKKKEAELEAQKKKRQEEIDAEKKKKLEEEG